LIGKLEGDRWSRVVIIPAAKHTNYRIIRLLQSAIASLFSVENPVIYFSKLLDFSPKAIGVESLAHKLSSLATLT
jgi:hypothetical protein